MIAVEQIDDLILCCWGFECSGDTTRNVGTADVESIASRELRSDLSAGGQIREPTGAQNGVGNRTRDQSIVGDLFGNHVVAHGRGRSQRGLGTCRTDHYKVVGC